MPATAAQYAIIKRPLLTEKSSALMPDGVYTFEVDVNANKLQIAQAIRDIFNVKVKKVRTVTVRGRKNRRNRFGFFSEPNWKKALITLEEGQSIEIK
ncbi:MAG: 50S ribosomal protein L23 [Planctomycetes bacterium]|jgi:large subunit ribosomal protein L23|nr:50S ribosomal protein L23 [Planctomycetota bacterium]MCL4729407.1 50S ribosomal protein L23 [Planctomycetota bacterium]